MVKKLIFYWYVSEDDWHWSYDLHFKNLGYYKDCFDKKLFAISYNKEEVNNIALNRIVNKIKEIMPDSEFVTYENDKNLREVKYFYEEIAQKLTKFGKNEAVFFAHSRGRYTEFIKDKKEIEC